MQGKVLIGILAGVVLAVPAPALAAKPVKGATYGREFDEISFDVSRGGGRLRNVQAFEELTCPNGREGFAAYWGDLADVPVEPRVQPDGSFSATLVVEELFLDPFVAREEIDFSGRFPTRNRARVTVQGRLVSEAGTVCEGRKRTVTARRVRGR